MSLASSFCFDDRGTREDGDGLTSLSRLPDWKANIPRTEREPLIISHIFERRIAIVEEITDIYRKF